MSAPVPFPVGSRVIVRSHEPCYNGQAGTVETRERRRTGTMRYVVRLDDGGAVMVSVESLRAEP